jgi:hypothetical protein
MKQLALQCLNSVCDKYEHIALIRADVQHIMAIDASDTEVKTRIFELVKHGLIRVFECDPTVCSIRRVASMKKDTGD